MLALAARVWGLERLENDPVGHFQRKAGRQALEKPANKHFANSSRFALLAAFLTVNLRFQLTRRKRPMDRIGEKKIMPALWQAGQMYHILHSGYPEKLIIPNKVLEPL